MWSPAPANRHVTPSRHGAPGDAIHPRRWPGTLPEKRKVGGSTPPLNTISTSNLRCSEQGKRAVGLRLCWSSADREGPSEPALYRTMLHVGCTLRARAPSSRSQVSVWTVSAAVCLERYAKLPPFKPLTCEGALPETGSILSLSPAWFRRLLTAPPQQCHSHAPVDGDGITARHCERYAKLPFLKSLTCDDA
jgi:hypothetical protein